MRLKITEAWLNSQGIQLIDAITAFEQAGLKLSGWHCCADIGLGCCFEVELPN